MQATGVLQMNGPGVLYYPILYAAGAALALGGGVFSMMSPTAALPGLTAAMIGIGVVVATTLVQALSRPPATDRDQADKLSD